MPWTRTLFVSLLVAANAVAVDWPQWLGPTRDGISTETIKPWKEPLQVLWRQPVGEGHSSPVVAGGKVYLHVKLPGKAAEALQAFDAVSGKPLWSTSYDTRPFNGIFGNGPRGTPAVVDGKVYTFGITGVLACFDADSGQKLWSVDTLKEFNAGNLLFGCSTSPLIEGDKVLVNVGGKGASIVAFDRAKGSVVWKALDDKASYSSPIATGQGAQRQLIFLTHDGLVSLNPEGKLHWRFPFVDALAESSTTPVLVGDILIGSSITLGSVGLKLERTSAGPKVTKLWLNDKLNSYFSTPVPAGQHLYLVTGTKPALLNPKPPVADLHCVEPATGKILWTRPKVGQYHACLLRTGDGKLLLLEEKGELVLLNPDPQQYREVCRSRICNKTWAHPALSNNRLYIRDDKELICVALP